MSNSTNKNSNHSTIPGRKAEPSDRKEMLKQSLLKIRKLQARLNASEQSKRTPIAIVGMACRYPGGANDPEAFWQLLRDGIDAIDEVPTDRWCAADYYDPNPDAIGKAYVMQGGFLDDIEFFDAEFFEISPTEARQMDPQQRLLLQVTWEALERAGLAPHSLAGTATGAFVGMTASDFLLLSMGDGTHDIDTYLASGTSHAVAAGRLAYFLGLQGPAMTIDTACSSALLAVHQACQSLRTGECQTALAGGALLILSPFGHISACKGGMLSPAGRCKTFDASADGYVRAEGVAMLVLKRLADAEADGDNILAVIRGTASNQDGRSGGLTAPNGKSQEAVIKQALADASVAPADIAYVETHGTGTSLGDPIEVQALGMVHSGQRDPERPLLIGSVKTNIGHTEALAGVAGLMKVVLALQHQKIPPHLHCKEPNPYITWADYPIEVASELTDWPEWAERRIAGLSSFGFSGTNVHMIIEEAPDVTSRETAVERPIHLLTLSGRSESVRSDLAAAYCNRLSDDSSGSVEDVCFTANTSRSHFEFRQAIVAASRDELKNSLQNIAKGTDGPGVYQGKSRPNRQPMIAFLCTGQESQYVQMGRHLYDTQPTFRRAMEECDTLLGVRLGRTLLSVLYPAEDRQAATSTLLAETRYAQPSLFALEWSLSRLWHSWGILPSMVVGDGVGEITAACIAGALSLEDGLKLAAERGRLMQEFPDSNAMDDALEAFSIIAADVKISPPRLELISTTAGGIVGTQELSSAGYWRKQMGGPTVYGDAIKISLAQGCQAFVEIGPGASVHDLGTHALTESKATWLRSLGEGSGDWEQMLASLASLYVLGVDVNWEGFDRDYPRRRVTLPTYPFEQIRYPIRSRDPVVRDEVQPRRSAVIPDKLDPIDNWFYELAWRPVARTHIADTPDSEQQQTAMWVVFGDCHGVGESLQELFGARGADVIYVKPSDRFACTGDRDYCLRPDHEDDYQRFVEEVLNPDHSSCLGIVHLWSLDATSVDALTRESLEESQSLVSKSVLLLVQKLAEQTWTESPRLWLASRGAQPVEMADRSLEVAQAPLWGLGRTIAAEHAELWGGLIDLDPASRVSDAAKTLRDEVVAFDDEDQSVHRDGVRYVPQMVRSTELAHASGRLKCRPDRAYLVTGGLGGLGIEAACWLIQRGARRLILLGRTKLPKRRDWNDVDRSTGMAQQIAAVRELESLGASIHPVAVDVADATALSAYFETYAQEGWPPICGVLHAAGTIEYGSLLQHNVSKLDAVIRAKVLGGWLLHQQFENADLDFFVLYSSAASIMNSPMLGGYAAANAFLDALAHHRRARGLAAVSVNWGSWSETGMATRHDSGDRIATGAGSATIAPQQGYAALERILLQSATEVVVLPIDWQQWSHLYRGLGRSGMYDELISVRPETPASTEHGTVLHGVEGDERRANLCNYLSECVGGLLGLAEEGLDHEKRISQLGFDSLMAVELKNRLEKDVGVVVAMAALLQGPTIEDLTSTVLDKLAASDPADQGNSDTDSDFESEEGEL